MFLVKFIVFKIIFFILLLFNICWVIFKVLNIEFLFAEIVKDGLVKFYCEVILFVIRLLIKLVYWLILVGEWRLFLIICFNLIIFLGYRLIFVVFKLFFICYDKLILFWYWCKLSLVFILIIIVILLFFFKLEFWIVLFVIFNINSCCGINWFFFLGGILKWRKLKLKFFMYVFFGIFFVKKL